MNLLNCGCTLLTKAFAVCSVRTGSNYEIQQIDSRSCCDWLGSGSGGSRLQEHQTRSFEPGGDHRCQGPDRSPGPTVGAYSCGRFTSKPEVAESAWSTSGRHLRRGAGR